MKSNNTKGSNSAIGTGIAIIVVGLLWLLKETGVVIPYWVFSWKTLMIGIGLVIGLNSNFQKPASYILIILGSAFLLEDVLILPFNLEDYFWPIMLIIIGLVVIIKPGRRGYMDMGRKTGGDYVTGEKRSVQSENKLDIVSVFTEQKKKILSKGFLGGEIVTIFGGGEIDLTQSDIDGQADLEAFVIFGSLKLIVPPNWEVRTNVVNILGSATDKRSSQVQVIPEDKVFVVTGTVIFGAIDVRSY